MRPPGAKRRSTGVGGIVKGVLLAGVTLYVAGQTRQLDAMLVVWQLIAAAFFTSGWRRLTTRPANPATSGERPRFTIGQVMVFATAMAVQLACLRAIARSE